MSYLCQTFAKLFFAHTVFTDVFHIILGINSDVYLRGIDRRISVMEIECVCCEIGTEIWGVI